jgi:acetyl-CoA carboxylase carboxyl transferase subunit alpha
MNGYVLEFERPLIEIAKKIEEMREIEKRDGVDLSAEIRGLEDKLIKLRERVNTSLTRWQRVQIARHPRRPYTLDYISMIMTDFIELHGDRLFGDDKAIVGGFATFEGRRITVVGHQKGRDTKENIYRNFGMAHPEGYRKAMRIMELGAKFKLPVVVFIDTPGAYPGIGAEERGQAEAIARNLMKMSVLPTPIIIVIIGEGASGGALGIGLGDVILMMENAWYSVISPEGCAAILWRSREEAARACEALKVTAEDLLELGMIDKVIKEPPGGAHWDWKKAAETLRFALKLELDRLTQIPIDLLLEERFNKYRRMGVFLEENNA